MTQNHEETKIPAMIPPKMLGHCKLERSEYPDSRTVPKGLMQEPEDGRPLRETAFYTHCSYTHLYKLISSRKILFQFSN